MTTKIREHKSRKPPISIPLSFEEAVGGLLAVKPDKKKPAKREAGAKKKPGKR